MTSSDGAAPGSTGPPTVYPGDGTSVGAASSQGAAWSRLGASAALGALEAHSSLGLFVEAVEEYAIFSLDRNGAVQTWNVGAQRIKGYHEDEILGRHFSIFYPLEDQQAGVPDDALRHATAHGHWAGEGWRVRKDGAQFWANVVITAVFDPDAELVGFIKITRDETDRKIAMANTRELDVLIERERIALELSDTTVHDLFSVELALDSALAMNPEPHVADRIRDALTTLDATLKRIRETVTGHDRAPPAPDDVTDQVAEPL